MARLLKAQPAGATKSSRFRWVAPIALAGAGILAYLAVTQAAPEPVTVCDLVFDAGQQIERVPLAVTTAQQHLGLSGRQDVSPGMLFSWPAAAPRSFWMKNTHRALTVAFFDADGRVFELVDMAPESTAIHRSSQAARDALELPLGTFDARAIRVGSRLVSRRCMLPQARPLANSITAPQGSQWQIASSPP